MGTLAGNGLRIHKTKTTKQNEMVQMLENLNSSNLSDFKREKILTMEGK